MVDFETLLRSPVYATLGVPASLARSGEEDVDLRVLDHTTPLAGSDAVTVADFQPHVSVRASELATAGVPLSELDGALLTFSGVEWQIISHGRDPRGGAIVLNLQEP